ncbi:MAG: hypothetical protein K6T66_15390, partial [Peptococcaceae bacterium]|nr:hypothetical protein [Peptococcaceae bacterium]
FNLNITNPLPLPGEAWYKLYHQGTSKFTVRADIYIDQEELMEKVQSPNGFTFKHLGDYYKEKDFKLRPDLPSGL